MKACEGCGSPFCMETQDFEALGRYVHAVDNARAAWDGIARKAVSMSEQLARIKPGDLDRDVPEVDILALSHQMAEMVELYKEMLNNCQEANQVAEKAKRASYLLPPRLAGLGTIYQRR